MTITRTYTNNADNTAVVEHVTMTRREFDQALSVACERAFRAAHVIAMDEHEKAGTKRTRAATQRIATWCLRMAEKEAGSR